VSPARIITIAQMRAIDAASAAHGVATRRLMERAGAAVANTAARDFPGAMIDVLCGPGANGGDGYVAARRLRHAGFDVRVLALGDPRALKGDAASAFSDWAGPVTTADPAALRDDAVIIDALFGAGLARPLDGQAAALAQACAGRDVLSVDVPSGLPGDGQPPAGACFRATRTVTFGHKKPAHMLSPGLALCGIVEVADIGAPPQAVDGLPVYAWENGPALWRLPMPGAHSHKHNRGRVAAWAGAAGASLSFGATRLAATAALRAGAGWVAVALDAAGDAAHFSTPMALMCTPRAQLDLTRFDAIVFGSGALPGASIEADLITVSAAGRPLVLDGGGIGAWAKSRAPLPAGSVMTPHAGEFAVAFGQAGAGSKIEAAKAAAAKANAVMVLKGRDTVIAAPDGRAAVNIHASPWLATAGTGDVLAGMVAGLLGQGMSPFEAACAAVWLHGEAGLRCGPGLIADDLVAALTGVWARQIAEQAAAG